MSKEKTGGVQLVIFGEKEATILKELSGRISQQSIANVIGCSLSTFQRVLKRQKDMQDLWKKGTSNVEKKITDVFIKLCESGNVPCVIFFMKSRNILFQNVETREYIRLLEEAVLKSEGGQEKMEHIIHRFDGSLPSDPMHNYYYADPKEADNA